MLILLVESLQILHVSLMPMINLLLGRVWDRGQLQRSTNNRVKAVARVGYNTIFGPVNNRRNFEFVEEESNFDQVVPSIVDLCLTKGKNR